jgi:uncharacterized lipoprotein YmbA
MTTRRTAFLHTLGAGLLALTISGCSFFSRPDNHFYSLQPTAATTPAVTISGAPIAIDGIELPPGLDRRELVVRGTGNQLEVRGTQQWAAPLQELIVHTLAFNLANRVSEGKVILPGQAKPDAPTRSVYVIFQELAAAQDGTFTLDARWIVRESGSAERSHHERITTQLPSLESANIVTAMNGALATLSDRIATGITAP